MSNRLRSNTVTQMLLRIRVGLRTRHGSKDGMIDSLDRIRTTEVMNIQCCVCYNGIFMLIVSVSYDPDIEPHWIRIKNCKRDAREKIPLRNFTVP
jgi:hypothetical protein